MGYTMSRNEINIAMKLFKKRKEILTPDLVHNGHKFYVLNIWSTDKNDPRYLSVERVLDYNVVLKEYEKLLQNNEITDYADREKEILISDKSDSEKLNQLAVLNGLLIERIKLGITDETHINMAKTIILVDDEQNDYEKGAKPIAYYNNLKNELVNNSPVIRGFFLHKGLQVMKAINPSIDISATEGYLTSQNYQKNISIWKKYIQKSSSTMPKV